MEQNLRTLTAIVAAVLVLASSSSSEAQSKKDERAAASLFKTGIADFEKGSYDSAIDKFRKSYDLVARNTVVFAWAQAERLNDNCNDAIPLYEKLLNQSGHIRNEVVIRENLLLCTEPRDKLLREQAEKQQREDEAKRLRDEKVAGDEDKKSDEVPNKVPLTTTTRSRSGGADTLTVSLLVLGGIGVGIGSGLFVASNASTEGAENAATFETNLRLRDQADTQRVISFAAGATGLALIGYGVFRLLTSSETHEKVGGLSIVAAPDHQGVSYLGIF